MLTYRNIFLNCPSGVQGSVFGLQMASSQSDPSRCPTFAWQFPPARDRCPAGWDRYLEPLGPRLPWVDPRLRRFTTAQEEKRSEKHESPMDIQWYLQEMARNEYKWIQDVGILPAPPFWINLQSNTAIIRSIPIHAEIPWIYDDPGHPWPAQSRSARVRLRRARTKKASGMKTKIVQSLWPGQNSEKPKDLVKICETYVIHTWPDREVFLTRTHNAIIYHACGVWGGLQCIPNFGGKDALTSSPCF